jgi:hypothetical protein
MYQFRIALKNIPASKAVDPGPDPDPHQRDNLHPDPHPHQSDKLDPDPDQFSDDTPKCMEN